LVTGAGGFIGRALCAELAQHGAEVHASGRSSAPPAGLVLHTWHVCDVTDRAQTRRVFGAARPQVVFHLAARVVGSRALELVLPTFNDNLVGTVNVLHAAVEEGQPRVLCLGSLHEPDQEIAGVPPTPYAAAKFAAGSYARMFAELYSLRVSIARPFMVYGAGQTDYTKLVPYVASRLLRGEVAQLSSGAQGFDWVYVDDAVTALREVAERAPGHGETIDVGRGELTSVGDVARGIARRLSAEPLLAFGAIPDRGLEPTRVADVDKTFRVCGWRARLGVDAGLDLAVEWYRDALGKTPR
jgi:nucleoside-diphosphate-sugar epimerase